jgi:hypothetical protein
MLVGNEVFFGVLCILEILSGSSSTSSLSSSLSEASPGSVSASEIETLLGSLPALEDYAVVGCFFFFGGLSSFAIH